jgi:type IV secretory pathway ATPase VirB11/archaellum biosynthesis ATPase
MQETWSAFCAEMDAAIRGVLGGGYSPPLVGYAIGEIVHNYFRTRGIILTSFELRRLVAELLDRPSAGEAAEPSLVTFEREPPSESRGMGEEASRAESTPAASSFRTPPSPLVDMSLHDVAFENRLLEEVVATVRSRLPGTARRRPDREEAIAAIEAALPGDRLSAEERERLTLLALSEVCGLGLLDRLWADRSVRAVFVNAPDAVWVERNGKIERIQETFRDQMQLLEVVGLLAEPSASGIAFFRLRDGSEGTVVFPPAAPSGPALLLRRGEPGLATFGRLIGADVLDRPIADLLRIAARAGLNVVIIGPEGSGKTTLLAAIVRDLGLSRRVVTLARHREFRWPSPAKLELVASPDQSPGHERGASFAALGDIVLRFRPDLVVLDSVEPDDLATVDVLLARPERGVMVALATARDFVAAPVDMTVRLGRANGGLFRVVSVEDSTGVQLFARQEGRFQRHAARPSFAGAVHAAGYGAALASVLE